MNSCDTDQETTAFPGVSLKAQFAWIGGGMCPSYESLAHENCRF